MREGIWVPLFTLSLLFFFFCVLFSFLRLLFGAFPSSFPFSFFRQDIFFILNFLFPFFPSSPHACRHQTPFFICYTLQLFPVLHHRDSI